MPFVVSKAVTETAAAVVTSAAMSITPQPSNMTCYDDTFRILGIPFGKPIVQCIKQPVMHQVQIHQPIETIYYEQNITPTVEYTIIE